MHLRRRIITPRAGWPDAIPQELRRRVNVKARISLVSWSSVFLGLSHSEFEVTRSSTSLFEKCYAKSITASFWWLFLECLSK